PSEAPKTMDDLLLPKWKGKIALTNPILNNSFGSWFYFWQKQLGEQKADAFFKGLAAQNPTLFESRLTVSTNVNQGQFAIGLGFLTHVLSVGGPGGHMSFMKLDPQPGLVSGIALLKNQPHPNAALVLADTMINTTFLTKAASIGYLVPLPGIKSAIPGLDELNVRIMPDVPNQEADKFGAYLKGVFAK
ncbi:MAG: ABC transporter substrate-binding protein, partial [Chloroflexota bacterium]